MNLRFRTNAQYINTSNYNQELLDSGILSSYLVKAEEKNAWFTIEPVNLEAPQQKEVVEVVSKLVGNMPVLGLGLGALVISLAYGAETSKLTKGYYGCNYPVRNIETGKIQIVSLNTSYKMNVDNTKLEVSNVGVIDNEVFRVVDKENKVTGSLYLDENLLKDFVKSLGGANNAKKNRS
jgi:anthranilate/para-aminobenzoate synthase component II